MSLISDLKEPFVQRTKPENLGMFCFTLILIVIILKQPPHSFVLFMYSLSVLLHLMYISFYRVDTWNRKLHPEKPEIIIEDHTSSVEFSQQKDNFRVKFLYYISIFFFLLATIILLFEMI